VVRAYLYDELNLGREDLKQGNGLGHAAGCGPLAGKPSEAVDQRGHNGLDVDRLLQLGAGLQEGLQRLQMQLVVEDLYGPPPAQRQDRYTHTQTHMRCARGWSHAAPSQDASHQLSPCARLPMRTAVPG
jgi:hypothetical protein